MAGLWILIPPIVVQTLIPQPLWEVGNDGELRQTVNLLALLL